MLESVKAGSAQYDQYRLAMTILDMWATWRTPVLITFGIIAVITLFLFIRRMRGRFFLLFISLLLAASIIGLEWFKGYVQERKEATVREMVSTLPKKIGEFTEKVTKPVTEPLKKMNPFGS